MTKQEALDKALRILHESYTGAFECPHEDLYSQHEKNAWHRVNVQRKFLEEIGFYSSELKLDD